MCKSLTNLKLSLDPSNGLGYLWKYKYPWAISSAPSPENNTVTSVFVLTCLDNKYIPNEALIVVTS